MDATAGRDRRNGAGLAASRQRYFMQHFLYFLPLPQGHKSFLPTFPGGGMVARVLAKYRFMQWRYIASSFACRREIRV